jgi:hypothetical protein
LREQLEIREDKQTHQFSPTNNDPGPRFESSRQGSEEHPLRSGPARINQKVDHQHKQIK